MRQRAWALLVVVCAMTCLAQNNPVPVEQEPFHSLIFRNEHVMAIAVDIPPHQTTQFHRHAHQYLTVSLTGGTVTVILPGKPPAEEKRTPGEVEMSPPVAHTVRNDGDTAYRATVVEFFVPQGEAQPVKRKPSRYCNPHSETACVSERYLFCTQRVCVSEVDMGPGAMTMKHSHSTAHMVIAVSDLDMKDWIEGRPSADMRAQKSGQVLFLDAGITHQVENGPKPAHMIVVSWK